MSQIHALLDATRGELRRAAQETRPGRSDRRNEIEGTLMVPRVMISRS